MRKIPNIDHWLLYLPMDTPLKHTRISLFLVFATNLRAETFLIFSLGAALIIWNASWICVCDLCTETVFVSVSFQFYPEVVWFPICRMVFNSLYTEMALNSRFSCLYLLGLQMGATTLRFVWHANKWVSAWHFHNHVIMFWLYSFLESLLLVSVLLIFHIKSWFAQACLKLAITLRLAPKSLSGVGSTGTNPSSQWSYIY